jgi:putative restriction endonuclease
MTLEPFVANTDRRWFDYLASRAQDGRVDEVNFWSPLAQSPVKRMTPGEPVFFRLKRPDYAVAGYGFYAHFALLSLEDAWSLFGWKNGDPFEAAFLQRIGEYRQADLLDPRVARTPLACMVLRDSRFWPRQRWIPWGEPEGWQRNIVQGKTESHPDRAAHLLAEVTRDAHSVEVERELGPRFALLDADERRVIEARSVVREGQGTFRARVLDAYGRRCAITGERTEIVLDAAHIQPYLGPRSNHVQNGLALTSELHTLFDRGYVTISPDYRTHVSPALRARWQNGRRYYAFDGAPLAKLPDDPDARPSVEALEWRLRNVSPR